jgi:hypothetical protein
MIGIREFTGDQVIMTSDRLIFNTKTDNIILSTKKDIVMSTGGAVHINVGPSSGAKASNNFYIVNSPKIQLGLNNTEPVAKGQKAADLINKVLNALAELANSLTTATGIGVGTVTEPSVNAAGAKLQSTIINIQKDVEGIKSSITFTS